MFSVKKVMVSFFMFMNGIYTSKSGSIFGNRFSYEKNVKEDSGKLGDISVDIFGFKSYQGGEALENILSKYKCLINQYGGSIFQIENRGLSENEYITKTKNAIREFYKTPLRTSDSDINETLSIIYRKMKTTSKPELAVFTAHALFNTSVFSQLDDGTGAYYRSRGLLAIQGRDNYVLLNKFSNCKHNFVDNPSGLAILNPKTIAVTIDWWNVKMNNCKTNFFKTLSILKPSEYTKLVNECTDKESAKRLNNRRKLYDTLVRNYE